MQQSVDEALGEHGAVEWKAGYIPRAARPPQGMYLDERWLQERLDEQRILRSFSRLEIAERHLASLISYLSPLRRDSLWRRYRTELELMHVYMLTDISGLNQQLTKRYRELNNLVIETQNN